MLTLSFFFGKSNLQELRFVHAHDDIFVIELTKSHSHLLLLVKVVSRCHFEFGLLKNSIRFLIPVSVSSERSSNQGIAANFNILLILNDIGSDFS